MMLIINVEDNDDSDQVCVLSKSFVLVQCCVVYFTLKIMVFRICIAKEINIS